MILTRLLTLIVFLGFMSSEANAMWALACKLEEGSEAEARKRGKLLAIAGEYLHDKDFDALFAFSDKWDINPNHVTTTNEGIFGSLGIITQTEKITAMMVACRFDTTGEVVKRLLAYGGITISTRVQGIWEPLRIAVRYKNWQCVDALIACKELELSYLDIDYASSSKFLK